MKNKDAWKPPQIWRGETVFILGGGPSLKFEDLSVIHSRRTIGTNNAYQLGDWVDLCWFGDCRWYDWHRERLLKFAGLKISCCQRTFGKPGIQTICRGKPAGIETRPGFVSWNGNTGGSAINIAYHLGARKVVLIGFDMRRVNGEPNWHTEHVEKTPGNRPNDENIYDRYLDRFKSIAADARRLNMEIINTTKGTEINNFPIIPLEDCL